MIKVEIYSLVELQIVLLLVDGRKKNTGPTNETAFTANTHKQEVVLTQKLFFYYYLVCLFSLFNQF